MVDIDEITKKLEVLEEGRSQDMRLILARFETVEADPEALAKKQESQFYTLVLIVCYPKNLST